MSERLAADGLTAASLWVVRENLPARRFYESLGGRPVLEEPHDHGGFDLVEVAYAWDGLPCRNAAAASSGASPSAS